MARRLNGRAQQAAAQCSERRVGRGATLGIDRGATLGIDRGARDASAGAQRLASTGARGQRADDAWGGGPMRRTTCR
ncbi:hypothetical protein GUJ93_ZPchr0006g43347 [Zizania palustris]|uniref:Uncharacterized protein n=1 Tax=Zizania palustris TaxID=103762 RepID=A0A8J5TGK1_ZIZPA|nr:hypothetical protein GUJ93_ZPchr0006g43347 [Zizania palustris]